MAWKFRKFGLKEALLVGPGQNKRRPSPAELVVAGFWMQLRSGQMVTFDSILHYGVELLAAGAVPQDRWTHLLVDEFQDSALIDAAIYEALPIRNKFYLGDCDQCQPAGTLVRMSDGAEKPIEQVRPNDLVQSYCRHSKAVLRVARVTQVAERQFSGLMYCVEAGGRCAESTGNHRWLIRWMTGAERESHLYCTYLMRKGDRFRIGKTIFFRSRGGRFNGHGGYVIGVALRMRQEGADSVWVLRLHETPGEASAYEEIVSAVYGLPQACFMATNTSPHFSQENLDFIFKSIPNQLSKAVRCLQDHGRLLEFPLLDCNQPRTRRTVQEVRACNLLDSVMSVPMAGDKCEFRKRGSMWAPIKVTTRLFSGKVYSIDVEKHHKYIANGLVTCNSIYGFRGGSIEGLNRLWLDPKTERILLEHNYRSDQLICRAAQRLIEHNPGRPAKKIRPVSSQDGMAACWVHRTPADEIAWVSDEIRARALTLSQDSVAVLCRTNRLAQEIRQGLEARGIQVARRIMPELPGDWDLTRTLLALLNDPDNDLMAGWYLERVHGPEVARRARLEAAAAGVTLNEASLHIEPVELEDVPTMLAKAGISRESIALVAMIRCGLAANSTIGDFLVAMAEWSQPTEELSDGAEVLTMHSAKGREFDTVFLPAFEQQICPGKGDLEEERRLAYVACTRARHQLLVSYCQLREPPFCRGLVEVRPSQFIQEAGL